MSPEAVDLAQALPYLGSSMPLVKHIIFTIDKKTIYLAFLFLKVTVHLQAGHFVEILIFRLMCRSKHELSSKKNSQKCYILAEKWRF